MKIFAVFLIFLRPSVIQRELQGNIGRGLLSLALVSCFMAVVYLAEGTGIPLPVRRPREPRRRHRTCTRDISEQTVAQRKRRLQATPDAWMVTGGVHIDPTHRNILLSTDNHRTPRQVIFNIRAEDANWPTLRHSACGSVSSRGIQRGPCVS